MVVIVIAVGPVHVLVRLVELRRRLLDLFIGGRADVAHGKLVAIGYLGSERTTRRWVADAKRRWRRKHGRRTRPWIPEPGLWMQWDYGDGPTVEDRDGVVLRVAGVVAVSGGGPVAR